MTRKPRGLLWDVETSYINALTFGLYPDSISYQNILEDWRIHCASWKWLGEKTVYSVAESKRNDKRVVKALMKVVSQADFLIGHNVDKFDLKKLKARITYHKLGTVPPVPTVDTLKQARAVGAFTSNRLDYIGEYLDVGRKLQNAPSLWRDCFFGDKKALESMVKYNKQDVLLLEEVYLELLPHMTKHPNYNAITGTSDNCPKCGSSNLTQRGYSVTTTGRKKRFQCNGCGSWSQGRKTEHIVEIR